MKKLLIFLILCSVPSFASFNASTAWEVRTTGSDSNGGGFNTAATGTDRSQQDACYQSYTDLVIDGTTNTKLTSAAHPFDSTSPGNVINITSGTGFTVQRVQIVSVTGSTATVDKSLGTLSSTGGIGCLGGALATPGLAGTLITASNTVNVKAGTYTLTASVTVSNQSTWVGFQTTHNDGGTSPLITTATNTTPLLLPTAGVATYVFRNFSLSNTAATRAQCIESKSNTTVISADTVTMDGCSIAVDCSNVGGASLCSYFSGRNVEIKNSTTQPINAGAALYLYDSYIHDNAGSVTVQTAGTFVNNIISNATGGFGINALSVTAVIIAKNNSISGNSSDGIYVAGIAILESNILYSNGGYGINCGSTAAQLYYNAYGSNASGASSANCNDHSPITLTANPFTSSTNYALNSTAGGGSAVKGACFPGAFPGGTTTGSMSCGAVMPSASSSGSSAPYGYVR